MISLANDYLEGAHEKILQRLIETNREQLVGYGDDLYSQRAKEKIKAALGREDAQVTFLTGGTQTNQVIIASVLAPYEGVVAAETGHVSLHEAGAIEVSGHKVLTIPAHQGKIDAGELRTYLDNFYADGNHEHMVFPGMVYISWPTEYGTLYTKAEMEQIYGICREREIPLFVDGARLGYGLASEEADLDLQDLAGLCDIFYIGGTKVGALCGEAVVFTHGNMPKHFITMVKQRGALSAKGRLLGIQFDTLFTDDLYLENGRQAIRMAGILRNILHEKQARFYLESPTNQQFIIMENKKLDELGKHLGYSFWENYDDTHTVIRLATSWATTPDMLEQVKDLL